MTKYGSVAYQSKRTAIWFGLSDALWYALPANARYALVLAWREQAF